MSITNTPGTYRNCKVTEAAFGFLDDKGEKPCIQVTIEGPDGGTIDHLYRMYGGSLEWSKKFIGEAFGYTFTNPPTPIESLIGKLCNVTTQNKASDDGSLNYQVKSIYPPGGKQLAKAPAGLLASFAGPAKPAAPARPAANPPPSNDFADDSSVPF